MIPTEPTEVSEPGIFQLNRRDATLVLVLAFCTVALFIRSAAFGFIAYDDQLYVYSNTMVEQGITLRSLRWALTATPNGNWHPLTTITQLAIASLFGNKSAAPYHAVNVLLHVANVVLLFLFFRRATSRTWPAFFTALVWGLHPMRVESVAWVSELKDVLCGLFWILCMLAYLHYSRRRSLWRFGLVMLMYVFSLMGKPMAITMPAVLLLLDFWPLRTPDSAVRPLRWWTLRLAEKIPLLLISIADLFPQQNKLSFSVAILPFGFRVQNGLLSYVAYIRDLFLPRHLSLFYPHPVMIHQTISLTATVLAALLLLVITLFAISRARSQPYLLMGWLWFIGTLVPVIGLVQVGEQSRADRFTYMPAIGLTVALAWWMADFCASRNARTFGLMAGAFAALVLSTISFVNVGHWRSTDTLFAYVHNIDPDNYLALSMLGDRYRRDGNMPLALAYEKKATEIAPKSIRAHGVYGYTLREARRLGEAADQYQLAIDIDKNFADVWDGLGRVRDDQAGEFAARGDTAHEKEYRERAIRCFSDAIYIDPTLNAAREHLAFLLAHEGKLDEAIHYWEEAVNLEPTYAQAQGDLAEALRIKGNLGEAIIHYQDAIADGATNPDWEAKLSYLIATSPAATAVDVQPLLPIAQDACTQTKNQQPAALDAFAACLARVGRFDEAITTAQQAIAQANLAHNPALAMDIQKHLDLYQRGQPFVATAPVVAPSTTSPATTAPTPILGPVTQP